jgi:hypothetical protein
METLDDRRSVECSANAAGTAADVQRGKDGGKS